MFGLSEEDMVVAGLLLFAATRRAPGPTSGKTRAPAPPAAKPTPAPAPPPLKAILYRTPADGFDTTRVAVERAPGQPLQKRAIMTTPADAWDLVQKSGWAAVPDVQQLEHDPE